MHSEWQFCGTLQSNQSGYTNSCDEDATSTGLQIMSTLPIIGEVMAEGLSSQSDSTHVTQMLKINEFKHAIDTNYLSDVLILWYSDMSYALVRRELKLCKTMLI